LAGSANIQWPIHHLRELKLYKRRCKTMEFQAWHRLPVKGKSVPSFTDDGYGNAWLFKPTLLKTSRFLTALRMRSGTTADRITMNSTAPQPTLRCRKCDCALETMAHILGQCTHTKPKRIRRHDEITDLVADRIRRGSPNMHVGNTMGQVHQGSLESVLVL
jgi:hypothetical protein